MKTLYLFTSNYPYYSAESFLEDEIIFLSKKFKKVVIVPFVNKIDKARPIPANCYIAGPIALSDNRLLYVLRGLAHLRTIILMLKEFFRSKVYKSPKKFRAWGSSVRYLNNCLYNKTLKQLFKQMQKEDVVYFYWGTGQNLLSIVLREKVHLVSRFHGEWDLWEELYDGFHPFRTEVAHSLDRAVFIAKKGMDYFLQRYPYTKASLFPLGSKDYGLQLQSPSDGVIRVVSCSVIYPLKRVELIFEALNCLTEYKIEWTHLGGGSSFDNLKNKIKVEKRDHLVVMLPGMMTHDAIMNYYKTHHFDVFMNLSKSEGVPVSIMEAMSFNIPIVATDVGCTSEEVSSTVGELVPATPSIEEITNAIRKVLKSTYSPREYWQEYYNAEKNYSSFADMLINL